MTNLFESIKNFIVLVRELERKYILTDKLKKKSVCQAVKRGRQVQHMSFTN